MSVDEQGEAPAVGPIENGLRLLRERWWVLALCVLLGGGFFVGRAMVAEKQYEATATVLLQPSSLITLIDPNGRAGADPGREVATNLLLVASNDVARAVKRELRSPLSVGDLLGKVDVVNQVGADLLDITATESSASGAAALANSFADQFVAFRRDQDRELIESGVRTLAGQLASLGRGETAQRAELEASLQKVRALQAVTTGDVEVVSRAEPPTAASAPLPKRALASGVVLGGGLGLLLVVALQLADRRVRRSEEFERLYGIRHLASVPSSPRGRGSADSRTLEAYRILTGALGRLDPRARAVLVTSAVPGEGTTEVAVGLARAAALAGRRVVLVEADLRQPTLEARFGLDGPSRGVVTALVGGAPVRDLLRPIVPGLDALRLLPAGPVPPNAPELLRSRAMLELVEGLVRDADLVVLDAPAILPVADAHVLLDLEPVTACVVVARAGTTEEPEVRRARAALAQHGEVHMGLVVTSSSEA